MYRDARKHGPLVRLRLASHRIIIWILQARSDVPHEASHRRQDKADDASEKKPNERDWLFAITLIAHAIIKSYYAESITDVLISPVCNGRI